MDGLIDTAIIIDIYRGYIPAINWISANQDKVMGLSAIVWMEVVEGAPNKPKLGDLLRLMQQFTLERLYPEDTDWAMQQLLRYQLSHQVGINDCLIAASVHRLQIPFYTRNAKHFQPLIGNLLQIPY